MKILPRNFACCYFFDALVILCCRWRRAPCLCLRCYFPPPASSNDSAQTGTALRQGAASSVAPDVHTQAVDRCKSREAPSKVSSTSEYTSVTTFQVKIRKQCKVFPKVKHWLIWLPRLLAKAKNRFDVHYGSYFK